MANNKKLQELDGMNGVPLVDADIVHGVTQTGGQPTDKKITVKELSDHAETHVKANAAHASEQEDTDQAKLASVGKVQELIGSGRRVEPITSTPATLNQDVIYLADNRDGSSAINIGTAAVPAGTTAYAYYDGNGWVVVTDSGTPTPEAIMAALEERLNTADGESVEDATIPTTEKVEEMIEHVGGREGKLPFVRVVKEVDAKSCALIKGYLGVSTQSWKSATSTSINSIICEIPNGADAVRITTTDKTDIVILRASNSQIATDTPLSAIGEAVFVRNHSSRIIPIPEGMTYMMSKYKDTSGGQGYVTHSQIEFIRMTKEPTYTNETISPGGEKVSSTTTLLSSPIYGGCILHVKPNSGYKVARAHLCGMGGEVVCDNYLSDIRNDAKFLHGDMFSMLIPEGMSVRYEVEKADNTAISTADDVAVIDYPDQYCYGGGAYNKDDSVAWGKLRSRALNLHLAQWQTPHHVTTVKTDEPSATLYAGQKALGIGYSDVGHTKRYVGVCVSPYTYVTAIRNPKSAMHTEDIARNRSAYGKTYVTNTLNQHSYIGGACNMFAAYVMGQDRVVYKDYDASPVTITSESYAGSVQAFDLLIYTGHIMVCSGIYTDSWGYTDGNLKYIEVAEQTSPFTRVTCYTPEEFNQRFSEATGVEFLRLTSLANIPDVVKTPYFAVRPYDIAKPINFNDDICTYVGDKASFIEGEDIYINARRGGKYTKCEIYKDGGTTPTEIDISLLEQDGFDNEDWVQIHPTSLTAGKYKARLTAPDGEASDYTYFEVINLTLSAVHGGSNIVVTFLSSNGTPTGFELANNGGFGSGDEHAISASDISQGSVTIADTGYPASKNIVMTCKGSYGVAAKYVTITNA